MLLIFGVVYLGMILGGLPFLQLDRTGIPVTLLTMAISWVYLWFRVLH